MTLSTQFLTMIAMIGMGSYFGAAMDTYNRFLYRSKRKSWIVFCNDILFWLMQGLIIFYVLFLVNKGELRFYIFVALLCGFAVYQSLFKRGYLRLLEIVISMIISIYRFFLKVFHILIYKPIYSLVLMFISIIILIGKGFFILAKFIFNVLLFLVRTVFKPIKWIFSIIWGLFPSKVKKIVEKLYNKLAGYLRKKKNTIINLILMWRKGEKK